jgi:UDP-N-acetylmuramate dehydrogenase
MCGKSEKIFLKFGRANNAMTLSPVQRKWLSMTFGRSVVFDEPMSRHTYFHIGGPADAFVKPESVEKLKELILWCGNAGIPHWVMGRGSNILVKDGGIRGAVIVLQACLNHIQKKEAHDRGIRVKAMAGVGLQRLCRHAVRYGFGGMNFALGIPGSVGGGIRMNAGTVHGSMGDVVENITVLLPSGQVVDLTPNEMAFSYRNLSFLSPAVLQERGQAIILEACFSLFPRTPDRLRREAEAILKNRSAAQPVNEKSSGCFFKNPESGPPAGLLIEKAGLKGKSVGDAEVSARHANFIINRGRATAEDVLNLMEVVQEAVFKKFDILLKPEVHIVGEKAA